jgi:hypothetical protein
VNWPPRQTADAKIASVYMPLPLKARNLYAFIILPEGNGFGVEREKVKAMVYELVDKVPVYYGAV